MPTCDDLMKEFLETYTDSKDEDLPDSMYLSVDNYIDDLCLDVIRSANSIFEKDDDDDGPLFPSILSQVEHDIDEDIEKQEDEENVYRHNNEFMDDTDKMYLYCDDIFKDCFDDDTRISIDFNDVTPEEFQLYISDPNLDDKEGWYTGSRTAHDAGEEYNNDYNTLFHD